MKFPPYPCYIDSDIHLLGKLPKSWETKPLKRLASVNDDVLPESTDPELEIEYVDISSVSVEQGITNTELIRFGAAPSRARRQVRDGDVIVSTVRTYLKAIAPIITPSDNLIVSTGFAVVRPKAGFDASYARYALQAIYFMDEVVARSVGVSYPAINASELVGIKIAVPSLSEQRTIAVYLDRETAKLDMLITKQERLIELAQEKRQAIISQAVTKGLNPDAPMKDSGVEWLGNVPEHWRVLRNKVIFQEIDLRSATDEGELLTVSHITGVTPRSEKNVNMFLAETLEGYKCCNAGDLVINTMWAWMGALGISPCNGLVSPAYNVYRPRQKEQIDPDYYDLLSRIPTHAVAIKANSTGVWESRLRLYPQAFLTMSLCVPPIEEQREIVSYLSNEISKIKTLIEKSQRNIELMREHRTALISAAVTGKIDVREAA